MIRRLALGGAVLLCAALLACGAETEPALSPDETVDLSGSWRVRGLTTEVDSGESRDIEGTLILAQQGNEYTASFHLTTNLPTPDGFMPADVVGNGSGTIEGRQFEGSAKTQLIMGLVPGEAGRFPFAPRSYGPRLLSRSKGEVRANGTLTFVSENTGLEGETYAATRTRLTGKRVRPR